MAPLDDYKITTEDTAGKSVEELPKRPTDSIRSGGQGMTWKQLQQRFDALSKLIIQKFNAVLDAVAPVSHTHNKAEITDFPLTLPADGGNADTVDNQHAADFAQAVHTHAKAQITDFPAAMPADGGDADTLEGKSLAEIYAGIPTLPGTDNAALLEGHPASYFAQAIHDHTKAQITDFSAAMPADGGNADTVDDKHAADFAEAVHTHTKAQITDFPTALPASGGDADTVGGAARKNAFGDAAGAQYVPTVTSTGTLSIGKRIYFHNDGSTETSDATLQLINGVFVMNVGLTLPNAGTGTLKSAYWETAAATSAPNAIFDADGALRRTSGSSRRFKRNIADLPDAEADAVLQMRPVRFEFKLDAPGVERNGFIAEEVMEVAPQFVDRTTLEDGTVQCDNVRYGEITSALVSIVKRQQARIEALEARVAALETTNGGNAIG